MEVSPGRTAMTHWTVDAPTALDFDDVTELNVRLMGGTVAVLASDDRPSLAISELSGRPLQVSHSGGILTVSYDSLSWDGLLAFLKPRKDSVALTIPVPADCPIQLGVLSASAIVTGLHAGAAVKSMSGDITLDGVTGDVSAETMSGEVAACDIDGEIRFKSMSGGLTLAGGSVVLIINALLPRPQVWLLFTCASKPASTRWSCLSSSTPSSESSTAFNEPSPPSTKPAPHSASPSSACTNSTKTPPGSSSSSKPSTLDPRSISANLQKLTEERMQSMN